MSVKSEARTFGRMIRRATGVPFTVSMRMGKKVAQHAGPIELEENFKDYVTVRALSTCDCCTSEYLAVVTGSKGKVELRRGAVIL